MSFDSYIPRLCLFITIVSYALMGNPISAQTIYVITAYYNNMRYSVNICLEFSKNSFFIISPYLNIIILLFYNIIFPGFILSTLKHLRSEE